MRSKFVLWVGCFTTLIVGLAILLFEKYAWDPTSIVRYIGITLAIGGMALALYGKELSNRLIGRHAVYFGFAASLAGLHPAVIVVGGLATVMFATKDIAPQFHHLPDIARPYSPAFSVGAALMSGQVVVHLMPCWPMHRAETWMTVVGVVFAFPFVLALASTRVPKRDIPQSGPALGFKRKSRNRRL